MGKLNSEFVLNNDQGLTPFGDFEQAALQILGRPHRLDLRDCMCPPTTDVPASFVPHFCANSRPEASVLVLSSQGCHQILKRTDTVCDSGRLESSQSSLTCSGVPLEEAVILKSQDSIIECKDTDPNVIKFQPKQFIMFDRCKGRLQTFLHPSLAQELSCTTKGHVTMSEGSSLVRTMVMGIPADYTGKVSQSHPYFCSRLDDGSMAYREIAVPAFETLQCIRNSRLCNLDDVDVESQPASPYIEMEAESSSYINCNGGSQASGTAKDCYSHENSEDIDALLSSDDEVSSASRTSGEILDCDWHSDAYPRKRISVFNTQGQQNANPFDRNYLSVSVAAASRESTELVNSKANLTLGRKQHSHLSNIDALLSSDDEVSSASHTAGEILDGDWYSDAYPRKRIKGFNTHGQLNANPFDRNYLSVSVAADSRKSTMFVNCKADLTLRQKQYSHLSNIDTAEMCSRSMNADSKHLHSSMLGHCGSARKARKQKIRSTVKTLRKIIPGGGCMDAAVVLDEAIQYLKSLQNQVQQLEVNRQNKQSFLKCSELYLWNADH